MPAIRRSSTRLAAAAANTSGSVEVFETEGSSITSLKTVTPRKRKADVVLTKDVQKIIKQDTIISSRDGLTGTSGSTSTTDTTYPEEEEDFVPAVLSFNFDDARKHLIEVDPRFEDLFSKMQCKPFEHLEQVHPFRALATSILGQQISWMAAHSIKHKFIRLYDPSISENPTEEDRRQAVTFFPTPKQVASTDLATLRTAGLSGRKAEYIQDLAARFADGRLSTKKLLNADDEELAQMLIEVRGIGRWTVDMFAIFSLRRPDILPAGDLGVQRGLVRWFLSLHSPTHFYSLSSEKVGGGATPKKVTGKKTKKTDELPVMVGFNGDAVSTAAGASSVLPSNTSDDAGQVPALPPTFTPSIKKTLNKSATNATVPLPTGIDVALLKSRLSGKNKVKGAFLTPPEMAALTECWKPYRSLGVYYMWSLADATE